MTQKPPVHESLNPQTGQPIGYFQSNAPILGSVGHKCGESSPPESLLE